MSESNDKLTLDELLDLRERCKQAARELPNGDYYSRLADKLSRLAKQAVREEDV